jgi:hypothetical protein
MPQPKAATWGAGALKLDGAFVVDEPAAATQNGGPRRRTASSATPPA